MFRFALMTTSLNPASRREHGSDLAKEMQVLCAAGDAPLPTSLKPVQVQIGFYYFCILKMLTRGSLNNGQRSPHSSDVKCKRGFI